MKKQNLKLLLFCVTAVATKSFSQAWLPGTANSGTGIYRTGNVGINMSAAPTNFNLEVSGNLSIHRDLPLMTVQPGTWLQLASVSGNYGVAGSNFTHNEWLVKNFVGALTWQSTQLMDAISIDGQFLNPTNTAGNPDPTKTWWLRDPSRNYHAWGNDGNTYLQIEAGKTGITIDPSYSPLNGAANVGRGTLEVNESNISNTAFIARVKHSAAGGFCMTSSVNQDLAHAFTVIDRNFGGPANIQQTFNVNGNGQTQISTNATDAFIIQDLVTAGTPINFKVQKSGNVVIGNSASALNTAMLNIDVTASGANSIDVFNSGATSPANKLVFRVKNDGSVYAQQVTVQISNYPDYVFTKDYKLMSLTDLDAYIQANHHLPNVPSASDIEKDGANLGNLNKIQMEKIEQLTLYVLELKKEIEAIKKAK